MALEAVVFQQDPFNYANWKDCSYFGGGFESFDDYAIQEEKLSTEQISNGYYWDSHSPPSSMAQSTVKDCEMNNTSSPEICAGDAGMFSGTTGGYAPMVVAPPVAASRRKRRRTKSSKNKEEMENQRMTHIAVERNRRRQMNDYLAILRSLMPPSYSQRGDQASIVGGAINFVKELEQLLQSLEAKNVANQHYTNTHSHLFSNFFTFPQYSTCPARHGNLTTAGEMAERRSTVADIEVTMVESHANIKILSRKYPKQLLKMVTGFQSMSLTVLHLNITTVDQLVLYSISVKVEDDCQLSTVNEIANGVHDLLGMIQDEAMSS